jgi:hypothetical protein
MRIQLVISPYVKRHAVDSEMYSTTRRGLACVASQYSAHQETDPEAGRRGAHGLEAARSIETLCVWVANDVESGGPAPARHRRTMVYERATTSLAPGVRIDEQRIQLRVPVFARKNRRETFNGARGLEDNDVAGLNLFEREIDGVWVCRQRIAISGVSERRACLQCLEFASFRRERQSNLDVVVVHLFNDSGQTR